MKKNIYSFFLLSFSFLAAQDVHDHRISVSNLSPYTIEITLQNRRAVFFGLLYRQHVISLKRNQKCVAPADVGQWPRLFIRPIKDRMSFITVTPYPAHSDPYHLDSRNDIGFFAIFGENEVVKMFDTEEFREFPQWVIFDASRPMEELPRPYLIPDNTSN